jgi:putative transposase
MHTSPTTNPYKRHRFPAEIISHCVWLYFRFCLSYRDVEELMAERGVPLTYEAVRYWCRKFGQAYANQLRRRRPRPGDKLKGLTYGPRVMVTDKLASYGAAKRELLPSVEHRQHRYLNNRAENSHQPTRQRERRRQRFKSAGHAQRFLAAYGPIAQHFRPRRHLFSAPEYRRERRQRFQTWQEITGLAPAA